MRVGIKGTCPDTGSCLELDGRGGCPLAEARPFRCIHPFLWRRMSDGKGFRYVMWQRSDEPDWSPVQMVGLDGELAMVEPGWGNRPDEWQVWTEAVRIEW